jgi:RNA polymerase sigma factor (sigma-70 family)
MESEHDITLNNLIFETQQCGSKVRQIINKYTGSEYIDDVAQDVCLKLLENKERLSSGSFNDESKKINWLLRTTKNTAVSYRRYLNTRKTWNLDDEYYSIADPDQDPENYVLQKDIFEKALAPLPPRLRSVVELLIEGYNSRESAKILKVTQNAVVKRFQEIREIYRK